LRPIVREDSLEPFAVAAFSVDRNPIVRIVAQKTVFDQRGAGTDAKAVDPMLEPETQHVGHCHQASVSASLPM
jgi:hypothetical protein